MGKPYSMDLRERVVAAIEAGETRPMVAERFAVSLSTVGRYIRRKRSQGSVAPDQFGGYKPFALAGHEELLSGWIEERPEMTLAEIRAELAERNISVCQTAISNFLRRQGLSYKKNRPRHRARP